MPRLLYVAMHRANRSPSQRFRFEQYQDFLEKSGFICDYSNLLDATDDHFFYQPGHYLKKIRTCVRAAFRRLRDVVTANRYDVIYIQREAFMLGPGFIEMLFSWSRAKLVYDYDDAVWIGAVSSGNRLFGWVKCPSKIRGIIRRVDLVVAGNQYLADYAGRFNHNVAIIPTTINTEKYVRKASAERDQVCIGWSGSFSTIRHFKFIIPALRRLKEVHGSAIYFKVIGDANYREPTLGVVGLPWCEATEVEDLSEIDIGIMPLPDEDWERGKCGLKGLQYMALGIPTVMSPVGVNNTIIAEGENGYLATDEIEWVDKLSRLVADRALREKIGDAGRRTVLERYSVESQKKVFRGLLEDLVARRS